MWISITRQICCIFIKCTITTKLKESFLVLLVFHFNSKWKTKFKLKKMYWSIKQPTKNILFCVCVINSVLTPFFNSIWHIKYSSRQMFGRSSRNLFNSIVFSSNWSLRWITSRNTQRCSIKNLFLKVSQYSQENISVGVSFNKVACLKVFYRTTSVVASVRTRVHVSKFWPPLWTVHHNNLKWNYVLL